MMKELPSTKEVLQMPAYQLCWYLGQLGGMTAAVAGYITCVQLGPKLRSPTFTTLHESPLFGIGLPFQITFLALLVAVRQWVRFSGHGNRSRLKDVGEMSMSDFMEVMDPTLMGVLFGCISYLPVYLLLEVFRL